MLRSIGFSLALGVVAAAAAGLPGAQPQIDVQQVGPQVGAKVPAFSLPDQNGAVRTLESIVGPKGAILVFFRSADW